MAQILNFIQGKVGTETQWSTVFIYVKEKCVRPSGENKATTIFLILISRGNV